MWILAFTNMFVPLAWPLRTALLHISAVVVGQVTAAFSAAAVSGWLG